MLLVIWANRCCLMDSNALNLHWAFASVGLNFPGPLGVALYTTIARYDYRLFCFAHGLFGNLDHCFNKPIGL